MAPLIRTARPGLVPMTQSSVWFVSTVSTMLFVYPGRLTRLAAHRTTRPGLSPIRRYMVGFVYYLREPVAPGLRMVIVLGILL